MNYFVKCTECDEEFEHHVSKLDVPDFCPHCRSVDTLVESEEMVISIK